MAFDGIFIHKLLEEIKPFIINKKIIKAYFVSKSKFVFDFNGIFLIAELMNGRSYFYLSSSVSLTPIKHWLDNTFEKYLVRSTIISAEQMGVDRTIKIVFNKKDHLGYDNIYYLYLEFMGRDTNMIITKENNVIVDALKKTTLEDKRIIKIGLTYSPFRDDKKINPLTTSEVYTTNIYEGVSKILFSEIKYRGDLSFLKTEKVVPVILSDSISDLNWFKYRSIISTYEEFATLSEAVKVFYEERSKIEKQSDEEKELHKLEKKIILLQEKLVADSSIKLEKENLNLLSAWQHLFKKGSQEATGYDNSGKEVKIIFPNVNSIQTYIKNGYDNIKKQEKENHKLLDEIAFLKKKATNLDFKIKKIKTEKTNEKLGTPYDKIVYGDGFFLIGKNEKQNKLIKDLNYKTGIYFHLKDDRSTHIYYIGKNSQKVIMIGSLLTVLYNKAFAKVDVMYTELKNIERMKGFSPTLLKIKHYQTVTLNETLEAVLKTFEEEKIKIPEALKTSL